MTRLCGFALKKFLCGITLLRFLRNDKMVGFCFRKFLCGITLVGFLRNDKMVWFCFKKFLCGITLLGFLRNDKIVWICFYFLFFPHLIFIFPASSTANKCSTMPRSRTASRSALEASLASFFEFRSGMVRARLVPRPKE